MDRGFFTILGAQFLSALADNALFIAAIALLKSQHASQVEVSLLLHFFTISYVVLSPFVGAFADAIPKGTVMLICNGIKFVGCLGMLLGLDPLLAYAIVGFGAAAYSPAKYGIITEYLPHDKLVIANGWLEGSTVGAIILGTVLGGLLVGPNVTQLLENSGSPVSGPLFGILSTTLLYLGAALINLRIPKLNVDHKVPHRNPMYLLHDFWHCVKLLWRDPQGQLSLAVTTLFWGSGATMRLIVLDWAIIWLSFNLEQATRLIAIVAFGTAFGAVLAGRYIQLQNAFRVLPAGILMGGLVIAMLFVHNVYVAAVLMFIVGALGGFFVVPLNAMLQHRGHLLMGAGHSIAVQNFNENLGILVMVGIHAALVKFMSSPVPADAAPVVADYYAKAGGMPPMISIVVGFGLLLAVVMTIITLQHRRRLRNGEMLH